MDRSNHYETAFAAYLRDQGIGYIAVDESRRSLLADFPIKSLDFIIPGPGPAQLLIDVKGRRFPAGSRDRPRRVWECWSTQDDVDGLERWAEEFGPGCRGLLVFAYHLLEPDAEAWEWAGRRYRFQAVDAAEYRRHMRVRSPSWRTVSLSGAAFRELARPFTAFARPLRQPARVC
jgi:hypothetical protein